MSTGLAAALASGLALIALGCGGGDDDSGATALTKSEFVERATQICADSNTELAAAISDALEASGGQPSPQEAEALIGETVLPGIQRQVDAVRALEPPEDDADTIAGILDEAQAVLDDARDDPATVTEGEDPFAAVNDDLAAYGLTECAEGAGPEPQKG